MKKLLFILSFLYCSLASFSQILPINGEGTTVTINEVGVGATVRINGYVESFAKNFQIIEDVAFYEAFGHLQITGPHRVSYFYRRGTDHLTGGVWAYRNYSRLTGRWTEATVFYEDPGGLDMRDCWGGIMSNDTIVLFGCSSEYPEAYNSYALMIKGYMTEEGVFVATDTVDMFANGVIPQLQRGLPYGGIQAGSTPGTYYIAFWQFNIDAGTDDQPTFPIYRVDVLKTTDYFNTWTVKNVYEGAANHFSETVVGVFPDEDSLSVFVRRDPGGFLSLYESVNNGDSWTARSNVVRMGLNATKIKNPFLYRNNSNTIDLTVQDRDDGWLKISRGNTSSYFGGVNINDQELYAWNRNGPLNADDNYKLGYPSLLELETGKYMYVYAKQISLSKATLYFSLDSIADDDGLPVAPPELLVPSSLIGSTTALAYPKMDDEVGGYTVAQLNNIRWFEWDISTDNFSTFVTCRVRYSSGPQSFFGEIHEYRLASHLLNMYDLTAATTYQIRCRAVNLNGASAWTTTSFTTD